jgi:hypothetical protein
MIPRSLLNKATRKLHASRIVSLAGYSLSVLVVQETISKYMSAWAKRVSFLIYLDFNLITI